MIYETLQTVYTLPQQKNETLSEPLTLFLCKLVQQAGLPHAHVSYDDVFEYIAVVVRPRCHFDRQFSTCGQKKTTTVISIDT